MTKRGTDCNQPESICDGHGAVLQTWAERGSEVIKWGSKLDVLLGTDCEGVVAETRNVGNGRAKDSQQSLDVKTALLKMIQAAQGGDSVR